MEHNVSHVTYIQHIGKLYFSYVMYFTYICKNVIHNSGHDVTYISHVYCYIYVHICRMHNDTFKNYFNNVNIIDFEYKILFF